LALAHIAPDAHTVFPVLVEVFQEGNHPYRVRALEALCRLALAKSAPEGEEAVSWPIRILWDDAQARAKAAEVLGRMGPGAKAAVPTLAEVLRGSDNPTRIQAALALWRIDHRTQDVLPALTAALRSPFTPLPRSTLTLPGRFGIPGAPPAPLCQQAAEALGQMAEAPAAVPPLKQALQDPQLSEYRPYYALALVRINRQSGTVAFPALRDALDRKGPVAGLSQEAASAVRRRAAAALGRIAGEVPDAIPALRKALADPDAGVRQEAARALGQTGT
jgi:HEAT repeat protein